MSTLYLTPAEHTLFQKIPAAVRKLWQGTVADETGTAWETPEQMQERAVELGTKASPLLKTTTANLMRKLQSSGLDSIAAEDVPPQIFPVLLLTLGAVGITDIILDQLQRATSAVVLDDLAELASARHQILVTNALHPALPR